MEFSFTHQNAVLEGDLHLPEGAGPFPTVVFVHGDADMPRDGYGYYKPFIQMLNKAGFAVASWDKAGVGSSTGDWLTQSMGDRQAELSVAIETLRLYPELDPSDIGLMGWSQAGWVMPKAMAQDNRLSFMVAVSPSINWNRQSRYLMHNRLKKEGYDDTILSAANDFEDKVDALIEGRANHTEYLTLMKSAPDCCNGVMSPQRWVFVGLNAQSDSSEDITRIRQPTLVLLGDKDLNVDIDNTANVFNRISMGEGKCNITVTTIKNADHSLLPSVEPRIVTGDASMLARIVKIDFFGEGAFAKGTFSTLSEWLKQRHNKC